MEGAPKWIVENKSFCEGPMKPLSRTQGLSILQDSKIVCPKGHPQGEP